MFHPLTDQDISSLQHGDILTLKADPAVAVTWLGWEDRPGGRCLGLIAGKQYFFGLGELVKFSLEIEEMHEDTGYDA